VAGPANETGRVFTFGVTADNTAPFSVQPVADPETLARLSAVGPNDCIVIGGGGLFMDYFEPFWRGFDQIAQRGRCRRDRSSPRQWAATTA